MIRANGVGVRLGARGSNRELAVGNTLEIHYWCTSSCGLSVDFRLGLISTESRVRLGGSKHCSLRRTEMELPPPHVLLQLDAIIVAQRENDGNNESVGDADEDGGDTTVAYDS